jgi:uncharacterized protein
MIDAFVRLHLGLARRKPMVLLLLGVFVLGVVWLIPRLRLEENFTDMLPLSDPAIAGQFEALRHFRQADRLFLDVQTATPDPGLRSAAADRMSALLRQVPGLDDLRDRLEDPDLQEVTTYLRTQIPALLNADDLRALDGRLAPASVEKRLAWFKSALSRPQGLLLADVLRADPVGLSDFVLNRLRTLQTAFGTATLADGRITSADGRHVLLTALPAFPPSDRPRSATLLAAVLKAARTVEAGFPPGSVRIAVTGAHRIALDNATRIERDANLTMAVATLAILGLLLTVYRRRWLAFLTLAPVGFGALFALATLHVMGDRISAIALGCGSILIGITVDYGTYVLYRADDDPPRDRAQLARMAARLAPPILFGALTTLVAFLAMLLSPVAAHRQVGLFAAVAVTGAAFFSLVLLPVLLPVDTQPRVGRPLRLTCAIARCWEWLERRRTPLLLVCLFGSGLCVVGVSRLRIEDDLSRLNGASPDTRRDEQTVQDTWVGAVSLTTVIARAPSLDEALRNSETIQALAGRWEVEGRLESFSSIASLWPSSDTRRARLRAWNAFWTEARQRGVSNALALASGELGFRSDSFQPFLDGLQTLPASTITSAAPPVAVSRLLGEYVLTEPDGASVYTLVKLKDARDFAAFRDAVRGVVPGALLLNKTALGNDVARVARRALPLFALLVAAGNALLLLVFFGQLELVIVALLPVFAGVFWTLGTLGVCGVPVNIANFIFVIFVVGVGVDYTLFLVQAKLEPLRGLRDLTPSTGGAVTVCALTTLLGNGVLVLAGHPALFSIGLTALLGIGFSLLATLSFVPICMDALIRRHMDAVSAAVVPLSRRRKAVGRLYRYLGPYAHQFAGWKMRTDPLFRVIEDVVPRHGFILDLGCGFGMAAHWLALGSADRTVLGVDDDAGKIRVAQAAARGQSRIAFEERNLLGWDLPACDVVLLFDVLHYLPRPLKAVVLAKVARALLPGGRLIIRDAAADAARQGVVAWAEQWAVRLGQNRTAHGLHFETLEGHRALLCEAGFGDVEVRADAGFGSNRLWIARIPRSSLPTGPRPHCQ